MCAPFAKDNPQDKKQRKKNTCRILRMLLRLSSSVHMNRLTQYFEVYQHEPCKYVVMGRTNNPLELSTYIIHILSPLSPPCSFFTISFLSSVIYTKIISRRESFVRTSEKNWYTHNYHWCNSRLPFLCLYYP